MGKGGTRALQALALSPHNGPGLKEAISSFILAHPAQPQGPRGQGFEQWGEDTEVEASPGLGPQLTGSRWGWGVTLLVQTLSWSQGWNFWECEWDRKRLTHPSGSPCHQNARGQLSQRSPCCQELRSDASRKGSWRRGPRRGEGELPQMTSKAPSEPRLCSPMILRILEPEVLWSQNTGVVTIAIIMMVPVTATKCSMHHLPGQGAQPGLTNFRACLLSCFTAAFVTLTLSIGSVIQQITKS